MPFSKYLNVVLHKKLQELFVNELKLKHLIQIIPSVSWGQIEQLFH